MPGRPRDPHIAAAVIEATLAALDEGGYTRLTVEDVARRAGATKPAIYRRWPTRQHLVLAALSARISAIGVPDTGCTMCDLGEGIDIFVTAFQRIRPDVLGPLFADCAAERSLREEFMTSLFEPPRTAVAQMLDRAVAKGDLRPDVDTTLVLDMIGALVHYRALFGLATTGGVDVGQAVDALLRGIAADYPALLAHSRAIAAHDHEHV
ncbi:TetR/AcrR family transcriptional regulator [Pseudonocardia sp. TRM90224]|uniref:TetR/AcrR family transcriptional regulator n=1 Tax=Pseudonocardia sp. TRM90224 TaxID=2812678 RepID=UPI001E4E8070|nr:TetR/AcrR family transcriptional regulator [Pseudonocardia sp. TRM90224]